MIAVLLEEMSTYVNEDEGLKKYYNLKKKQLQVIRMKNNKVDRVLNSISISELEKAIKFLEEANKELAQQINYKKKIVNAVDKKQLLNIFDICYDNIC